MQTVLIIIHHYVVPTMNRHSFYNALMVQQSSIQRNTGKNVMLDHKMGSF